ncbi:hypothetical protein SmJEL517_g04973 [Synchytrium microbalum]|uniref:Major facilitator superfamily (MFS) profile domain-containing protein n=1 Tax=Synchytrium microbalum TaxID=1806994 RepID=A0A507BY33_9FUNG|nr:uncharacterized protein SmJEL517_g04973 [Synchytrium microbalum]TPX31769.1 hypothetical protein SmJEL517_g04973 [Synchytrium microbalum]
MEESSISVQDSFDRNKKALLPVGKLNVRASILVLTLLFIVFSQQVCWYTFASVNVFIKLTSSSSIKASRVCGWNSDRFRASKFEIPSTGIATYGSSLVLSATLFRLLWYYGRKLCLGISLSVLLAGTVLCAFALNIPDFGMTWFAIARVIQGFGAGGVLRVAMNYIADMNIPTWFHVYFITTPWIVSLVLSPLIGGILTDNVTWRLQFYVSAGLILIVGITSLTMLPTNPKANAHEREWRFYLFDWTGLIILASCISAFLIAFQYAGQTLDFVSPAVIVTLVCVVLLGSIFAVVEISHSYEPIVPVTMMARCRNYKLCCGIMFLFGIVFSSALHLIPLYLQFMNSFSATQASFYLWITTAPFALTSILAGTVSLRSRNLARGLKLLFILPALGVGLISGTGATQSLTVLVVGSVIFGTGMGTFQAVLMLGHDSIQQVFKLDGIQHIEVITPMLLAMFLGSSLGPSAIGSSLFSNWVNKIGIAVGSSTNLAAIAAYDAGQGSLFSFNTLNSFGQTAATALQNTFAASFAVAFGILTGICFLMFVLSCFLTHLSQAKEPKDKESAASSTGGDSMERAPEVVAVGEEKKMQLEAIPDNIFEFGVRGDHV